MAIENEPAGRPDLDEIGNLAASVGINQPLALDERAGPERQFGDADRKDREFDRFGGRGRSGVDLEGSQGTRRAWMIGTLSRPGFPKV